MISVPVDSGECRMLDLDDRRSRIRWNSSELHRSSWMSNSMY